MKKDDHVPDFTIKGTNGVMRSVGLERYQQISKRVVTSGYVDEGMYQDAGRSNLVTQWLTASVSFNAGSTRSQIVSNTSL